MARPRTFDEQKVLSQSREIFATQGYNGTSIDDLVRVTGLLRGSLYKAFGSKRNLFLKVLSAVAENFEVSPANLDLLTVALKEAAPQDVQIRDLCRVIVNGRDSNFSHLLGTNLLAKI